MPVSEKMNKDIKDVTTLPCSVGTSTTVKDANIGVGSVVLHLRKQRPAPGGTAETSPKDEDYVNLQSLNSQGGDDYIDADVGSLGTRGIASRGDSIETADSRGVAARANNIVASDQGGDSSYRGH